MSKLRLCCFALMVAVGGGGCGSDNSSAACTEGTRRCGPSSTVEACVFGGWRGEQSCAAPATCVDGACVGGCVPLCAGRVCGGDGCDGSCGSCTAPALCSVAGACVPPSASCGDATCDQAENEDCATCPQDCRPCTVSCAGTTPEALMACVDQARYMADLSAVAVPRPHGSTSWEEVRDHCANVLRAAGFTVELQAYGTGTNVVGTRLGTSRPGEHVVLSAHYDAVGNCEAADDNASGVAGILEAARVLASRDFARTLVVACWDQEEAGEIGSFNYTRRANDARDLIAASVVFDMIGYSNDAPNSQTVPTELASAFPTAAAEVTANDSRANFAFVVGDVLAGEAATAIETFAESIGRVAVRLEFSYEQKISPSLSDFWRSDHAAFWVFDYPAVFVSDTSGARNPNYHCSGGDDAGSTLDPHFATDIVKATVGALAQVLDSSTAIPPRPAAVSCADLCAQADSGTAAQVDCIVSVLEQVGLPLATTPACASVATVGQCTSCFTALGLLGGDCTALHQLCL
jgi:hypothetical protein